MAKAPPLDLSISIACSHLLSDNHFLVWRCIVCLYFWFLEIYGHISRTAKVNFYLTFWALHLCTVYISISLYCTFLYYKYAETNHIHPKCAQYCRYSCKVQCIALPLSLAVVVAWWAFEYAPGLLSDPLEIQVHAITALLTAIDFYLCYNSVSFGTTWWYSAIVEATFGVWSIIYTFIANESLYAVLDWKGNAIGAAITVVAIIVVSIIIYILLCWTNNKLISMRLQSVNTDDMNAENAVESIQLGTEINADETNIGLKMDDDSINPQTPVTPHELP
eukprot:50508_1